MARAIYPAPVAQAVAATPLIFTRDGGDQEVIEDTGTPANNVPLPVKLSGVTGDINVTAGDLHVQLEHTGLNPDSARIGDGTNTITLPLDDEVDTGPSVKVGGKVEDDISANAYVDDDRQPLHLDSLGRLHVTPTPASQVADNDPSTENATPASGVYNATPPTYGDGDKADLQLDVNGKLLTSSAVSSGVADNDADSENPIKVGAKTKDPTTMPTYVADDRANLHTDLSGRLISTVEELRQQNVADNAADSGNGVKVAGRAKDPATLPTYTADDRANLHTDLSGRTIVTDPQVLAEITRLGVVDFLDAGILDASVTTIPRSSNNAISIVATLAAGVNKINIVDDIGAFMALYDDAVRTNVLAYLPLGGGDLEIKLAAATAVFLGAVEDTDIVSGKMVLNFLG